MCRNYFVFKNNQKMFNISRQIRYKGTFYDAKKPLYYWQPDFLLEMWFRCRLQYQPKVSANFGFGFGIGPKPKQLFWSYIDYLQISGIVGGNFDLGKIDTYIHLREDNGVEPFHQFGLELDVMEVRFDYMSTSVLMGRVSHLLLKVSTQYITQ